MRGSSIRPSKALLLGIDTPIGLAIIRELGRRGVEIYGIGRDRNALGFYSRYLTAGWTRAPGGENALIDQLRQFGNLHPGMALMAISEPDTALLNRNRAQLSSLRLLTPSAEQLAIVTDKKFCQVYAQRVGLQVPKTYEIANLGELSEIRSELRFPVVLKWSNPNLAAQLLGPLGLEVEKSHYCYSYQDLCCHLSGFEAIQRFPLIQEYCAGYGLGQFVFLHKGEPIRTFQHRRLREWPPEGGISTACEVIPLGEHQELMEKSVALLRSLRWDGVAMVEFRYDPSTRNSVFLEINGRFWGSLPLAYHAGADFAWLTYSVLGEGVRPQLREPSSRLRCRFMIPDTKRLVRVLFDQGAIQDKAFRPGKLSELATYLIDFVRPNVRYFVFDWRDPMPFFVSIWQTVCEIVRQLSGRRAQIRLLWPRPTQ